MISIVYVNWNTRALLENSLRSLCEQQGSEDIEIIVVDNGSTDGTVDWVRSERPEIKLIALDENVGFGVGNNIGAKHARGNYLLLLNTDTIVLSTMLPTMRAVLDTKPDVGCVGARHLNADRSLQRSMDSFPNLEADFLTLTELHRLPWVSAFLARRHAWWGSHEAFRDVDWVNGACMMFRSHVFDEVGGFDPNYFIYGEELDLCFRMRQLGWRTVFTPAAEVVHLGGASMDHVSARRLYLKHEGLLRFYDKHRSIFEKSAIRLILLLTLLCRSMVLLVLALLPSTAAVRATREMVTQLGPDARIKDTLKVWGQIGAAALRLGGWSTRSYAATR